MIEYFNIFWNILIDFDIPMPSANTATALAPHHTNTNTTQDHTTPHIEIHKKYLENTTGDHSKTAKNRWKSRLMTPLGDPGTLLGAPGAPLWVQGRKSAEKRGSFPPVPGPVLEYFSVKDCFFHKKVRSWSVFFANRFFIKLLSDFWLIFNALEPQKHKF